VDLLLAPGGALYAIVTGWDPTTTVVTALDREGRPAPGWPVAIPGAGGVLPAFGADGTLYLKLTSEERVALTAIDRNGTVAAGWPANLSDVDCNAPITLPDGTLRLVCHLAGGAVRAYAFDRRGRALPGWPVVVPAGKGPPLSENLGHPDLNVALGTNLVDLQVGTGWARRFAIAAEGTVRLGTQVTAPVPTSSCYRGRLGDPSYSLGPDGTAYMRSLEMSAPGGSNGCRVLSSTFTAFDERGVRAGWPVTVSGETSEPTPGPFGRIYVTQGSPGDRPTRIFAFDAGGRRVAGWPVRFNVAPVIGMSGAGWSTAPVRVGADGTVYLITEDRGTTIYALSPAGKVRPGWPYRSTSLLGDAMPCGCTGGGHPIVAPIIDAAGRIHFVHEASSSPSGSQTGSRVTLVTHGRTSPGWPVTLARTGSRFLDLEVDGAGVSYALAMEYEGPARWGTPLSATLLAIGPDGTVLFRTTIVEP
jgi:hypothetical protein